MARIVDAARKELKKKIYQIHMHQVLVMIRFHRNLPLGDFPSIAANTYILQKEAYVSD